jgi:error-prone DNA polymerase
VATRRPDINRSLAHATLEPDPENTGGHAIRLGLATIANVGDTAAEQIVAARDTGGPFTSIGDLGRRTSLTQPQLESLATAGVFDQLGPDRRQALWAAGAAARDRPGHLPGIAVGLDAPALPGMSTLEIATADALITGITPGTHPVEFLRAHLTHLGARRSARTGPGTMPAPRRTRATPQGCPNRSPGTRRVTTPPDGDHDDSPCATSTSPRRPDAGSSAATRITRGPGRRQ